MRPHTLLVLAALVLPGCAAPALTPADDPLAAAPPALRALLVTDAPDDAVEPTASQMAQVAARECRAFLGFAAAGCAAVGGAVGTEPGLGPPAPPALDLRSVSVEERPEALVIVIEIGSLDAEMLEAAEADSVRARGAGYTACWNDGQACVAFAINRYADTLVSRALYWPGDRCGGGLVLSCGNAIEYEVTPGAPATIALEVPRDILPAGAAGDLVDGLVGTVYRTERIGEYVERGAWLAGMAARGATLRRHAHVVDVTEPAPPYALQLERVPFPQERISPIRVTTQGDVTRADMWGARDDLDILEQSLWETPTHVTISIKLLVVEETPRDHHLLGWLLTQGRAEIVFGASSIGGATEPWALRCVDEACDEMELFDATMERVVASPGWVNVTLPRADIGAPMEGELLEELLVHTRAQVAEHTQGAGPAAVRVAFGQADDTNRLFPAYRWRESTAS